MRHLNARQRVARYATYIGIAWLLLAASITAFDWQGRWHTLNHEFSYLHKLYLYWAQYAAIPFLIAILCQFKMPFWRWRNCAVLCGALPISIMIWSGHIEPHLLFIKHTTIQTKANNAQPVRLAVVADLHWGLFVRDFEIERLVNALNRLDVDAVVVAGDWTYEPQLDLEHGFAPFSKLHVPIFAVLGNHDVERPGPKLASELRKALQANHVQLLEGQTVPWKGWLMTGLDDLWGGQPDAQIRAMAPAPERNRIVIAHQPDTAAHLPAAASSGVQLVISGHTHGGQVNLPWITKAMLERTLQQVWHTGLYQSRFGQIFVTTGTGMVGLPFRFRMAPRIDVLHIEGIK